MTDEELAEEYATKECCTTCKNINHFCKEKCECWVFAKKGFLAGRSKWHRVVDGDLPPVNLTVLNETGNKVIYYGAGKWEEYSDYYEDYVDVEPPVAWCKVPEYTEVSG